MFQKIALFMVFILSLACIYADLSDVCGVINSEINGRRCFYHQFGPGYSLHELGHQFDSDYPGNGSTEKDLPEPYNTQYLRNLAGDDELSDAENTAYLKNIAGD